MEYKSIKGFNGFGQFGMLLVFLGLGFVLAAAIQLVIFMQVLPAGTSLMDSKALMDAIKSPKNVSAARAAQVMGTFALMFIPAVLWSLVVNGKNKFWLGFNKHINWQQVAIGFAIIFLANILAGPLADLSKSIIAQFPALDARALKMENEYNEQVMAMSNLKNWGEFVLAIFIMAFFPAMFEEMFFRGTMQNLFVKWWKMPLLAIIFTSLIFSLIHFSIYLFISRAILGFVLGMMFYKSKNIWVNIIAHFLNNALAVIGLFYEMQTKGKVNVDAVDPKVPWWGGLLALAAIIFLFWLFDKYSVENKLRIDMKEQALMAEADPFAGIAGK